MIRKLIHLISVYLGVLLREMAKPLLEHLKANLSLVTVDSGGGQVWLLDFRRQNRSLASNRITHFFLENINRFTVLNFTHFFLENINRFTVLNFSGEFHVSATLTLKNDLLISFLRCCRTMFSGSEV